MRKMILIPLMFLIMLTTGAAASGKTVSEQALTVLGDSIASGYGLSEYTAGNNYSAPLSFGNMLGAQFGSYRNFAVDGRTSRQLLDALENPGGTLANAVFDADVIVISIGGNDFLQPMISELKKAALTDYRLMEAILGGKFKPEMLGEYSQRILNSALEAAKRTDIDGTAENIRQCVEKILSVNPDCRIILMTVYDPFSGNVLLKAASDVARERLPLLNDRIKSLASENVSVIDVYAAFENNADEYTNISRFDIHPNADGHNKIYELLKAELGE